LPGSAGKGAGCERVGGVVGAEFRGRVHEESFRVLWPEFKRVFLYGVRGAGTSSECATTISFAEFDSAKALVGKGFFDVVRTSSSGK